MREKSFGLLCVGNELLSGKVVESNLAYWIQEFKKLGRRVTMAMIAPDEPARLEESINFVRQHCDCLLLSGGIGPTHDDLTLSILAKALGRSIYRHPRLVQAIETYYGDGINEHLLSMADLPEGTELLYWDQLLVPLFRVENIYIFPGAPNLLRRKFSLLSREWSPCPVYLRKFFTSFDEGEIAEHLERIESDHAGVMVGSYPKYEPDAAYKVLVTIECRDSGVLDEALGKLLTDEFREGILETTIEDMGVGEP